MKQICGAKLVEGYEHYDNNPQESGTAFIQKDYGCL